ncbi:Acyl-CoA dehydrogenase related to the alkylation response protein AidB [Chelatococcus sambhunathii]|uniref:Acyl-CoA dehydrogenase related to the alkylation response protein AidB n=1 Tax=Chelatococcus sambhunathii TaxID=363953 RepID=A0ABM9U4D8_9HYPH|nr:acyl-CoA dehydrogenase [Chelatococcus sambhunathii]CUA88139.1 Acyl-CoA dehydrogenase related to the alkylation response protein AidB [Chelatococcus sambhunathii]
MTYRAPVEDLAFTMRHVAGLEESIAEGLYPDLSVELVEQVLEEAGRFASERIAPLNAPADRRGAHFADGQVTTAPGWREVYRAWAEAGWNALPCDPEWGGQGLPTLVQTACVEFWNASCMSFALGPLLTAGAVEALTAHASEDLKRRYLEKLVSGEWMGTMNLTEPQAGSDLNAVRTRAERAGDGTYRITGSKIFITYGEHDLTDNIVHLVLARLPDAPPGTRGISLFLVPKFFVNDDGSLGARNDVRCHSIEHKLGIHASPTCTMVYGDAGGAVGWLVGEENRGLACMFTMMNNARLAVGAQGVAIADRAYQQALSYARERRQGRAPGAGEGMSPIADHPDVQRMLLTMKATTHAARGICLMTAAAIDRSRLAPDAEARRKAHEFASLLTPVAKAFSTDIGCEVASLGVQVHGGMGFIEETGAAQHLRDARIAPIYEGTNGIQAIDLVMRKLPLADGTTVRGAIAEMRKVGTRLVASRDEAFGATAARLREAVEALDDATSFLLKALAGHSLADALAAATPYLRLFGIAQGGTALAMAALAASEARAAGDANPAHAGRIALARFFAENIATGARGLAQTVMTGASALADAEAALAG